MSIASGIPGVPIESIRNAEDARMALEEHLIETPTIIQRLDLLGIAMRNGRYDISVHNAGLHPVHIAPEFQAARVKNLRTSQPGLIQDGRIPTPLVLQVMNAIHDA